MQHGERLAEQAKLLSEAPEYFLEMPTADLFAIGGEELEAIQLSLLQRRFQELRPRIALLDRLASEAGITQISDLSDLARLGLPHTVYKSYSAQDVEEGRYDRLTAWLDALTAFDLSHIDVSECASLESWLRRIEETTPMRPISSSGTTGKISILPRGLPEDAAQLALLVRSFEPYRDEPGMDIRDGDVTLLMPWPADSGRQSYSYFIELLRRTVYAGQEHLVKTFAKGCVTADELSLASRLRRAETMGEEIILSDAEKQIAHQVNERLRNMDAMTNAFIDEAIVGQKGKRVLIFSFLQKLHELAAICKERGIKAEWSPDSVIITAGGTKGFDFPDGWQETLREIFPYPIRDNYGMSETTSGGIGCSQGHFHPLPWGINMVLDPRTGEARPRKGRQTGRLLVYDLLATSFWPATLSGDLVTIDFDGGCACGREGPYTLATIARLEADQGGNDKISSAPMLEAFAKLGAFTSTLS